MAVPLSALAQTTNTQDTQKRLDDLEKQLKELRASLKQEHTDVAKHHVSGYLQLRFDSLQVGKDLIKAAGSGGTGQRPTNGGPFVGGPQSSFLVRRGRMRVDGPLNPKDNYVFQLDFGNVGVVNLRDAWVDVKSGMPRNTNLRIGQFPPHFTYTITHTSRLREAPERPVGFSDSTNAAVIFKSSQSATGGEITPGSIIPLLNNQDRDAGAAYSWNIPNLHKNTTGTLTYGLFNGEGRDSNGLRNLGAGLTSIYRAEATQKQAGNMLILGASVYRGAMPVRSGAPVNGTPASFVSAARNFNGVDARWVAKNRAELRAEYLSGTFEMTPDRAQFLPGNKVQTWYATGRYPLSTRTDFAVVYDEFRPTNQTVAGVTAHDYQRNTMQFGLLYQLAQNTRWRLWYTQGLSSFDPSAAANSPLHKRVGLLITELQVEY
ncbi:MAG: porin [Armatimonas sp.]